MCVTNAVEEVRYAGLEQPFVYWDTPGITADSDAQKEFKKMARELKKKGQDVDLLILCAPASEGRDHPDNKSIVKSLTKALGKKVWSHAVIAFSQANLVVDPDNDITTAEYFHRECVTEMKFRYRKFLENCLLKKQKQFPVSQLEGMWSHSFLMAQIGRKNSG